MSLEHAIPAADVREATLIQVFLGDRLDDAGAAAMLDAQLATQRAALAALEAIPRRAPPTTADAVRARFFQRLTLEHGLAMRRAEVAFLEDALARLRGASAEGWPPSPAPDGAA